MWKGIESVFHGFENNNIMKTELEKLKVLSALKLGYGKLTAKNTTEAEFKNMEEAIEIVKNCSIPNVVGRSELLKAFCLHGGIQVMVPTKAQNLDELIEDFLESL